MREDLALYCLFFNLFFISISNNDTVVAARSCALTSKSIEHEVPEWIFFFFFLKEGAGGGGGGGGGQLISKISLMPRLNRYR